MHAIPAIIENNIAPPKLSSKEAPRKKPTIPARSIRMTDTIVLNFFIDHTSQIPTCPGSPGSPVESKLIIHRHNGVFHYKNGAQKTCLTAPIGAFNPYGAISSSFYSWNVPAICFQSFS